MKQGTHAAMVGLAFVMVLAVGLAVAGPAAAQPGRATSPVALVQALIARINRNDQAGALALLAPGFYHVTDPGSPGAHVDTAAQFLKLPLPHVRSANLHQTDAHTAEADIMLSGDSLPPVRHLFTLHAIFTVSNGRIIHIIDHVSPQTARDLAALGPPPGSPVALPSTGVSGAGTALGLLALAIMCGVGGVTVRRRSVSKGCSRKHDG